MSCHGRYLQDEDIENEVGNEGIFGGSCSNLGENMEHLKEFKL